ncbi:hypothetical protein AGOR_G00040430 [Albula goreensis]|uniref:Uncharacterized protein n=1 Tax=Albula goreensis TaxID=1534307 RepID=A0A8T3DYK2_9TELE|nr:hypothetical protein AGOR_G00040430 [Albula goreensis]
MAAMLVSQAQLGAIQEQSKVQTKDPHCQETELQWGQSTQQLGMTSHPGTQAEAKVRKGAPMMKVVHLTEKLRELEEGLNEMQRDQELQKELLSSSEEEVVEYEKRLAMLMNLLNQMTTKPRSQISPLPMKSVQASMKAHEEDAAAASELLQEVRREAAVTKEELNQYREKSDKLQEDIQVRDASIAQLKEELKQMKKTLANSEEEIKTKDVKRSGGKQDHSEKTRSMSAKEKRNVSKKTLTSQMDRSQQTPRPPCMDAGVQTNLVQPSTTDASEEISEVIREYTEKIGQMQDLHAAEIMDMETRHISESEALKRETQSLHEECRSLKALIEKLRVTEAASPRLEQQSASQFRDGYTSDSSSDWSQRTGCDPPSLHPEFRTTPEGARRDNETDLLPDRIKVLLREVHQEGMQVLSLSELSTAEGEGRGRR